MSVNIHLKNGVIVTGRVLFKGQTISTVKVGNRTKLSAFNSRDIAGRHVPNADYTTYLTDETRKEK